MSDHIIVPITPDTSMPVTGPVQGLPIRGEMRLVKLIQTMVGWRWCIWISPYTFQSEIKPGEMGPCRRCAVLMDPGDAKHPEGAQIALWTVPDVVLGDHAPTAPINW
jgi:hypothetical protein